MSKSISLRRPRADTPPSTPAVYGKITDDEQLLLHLFREIKDKKVKKAVIEFIKAVAK
jgi:hypothetical protein